MSIFGATTNTISEETWEALKAQKIQCKSGAAPPPLPKGRKLYKCASDKPLPLKRTFTSEIRAGQRATQAEFLIITGKGVPLLGRDTAIKLGTLKVGLDVASISEKETKSPVSRSLQWGGKAEISQNMNGSKLFSKLDLKWGYYQLELANDSRRIATFATHDGPYCYKRLLFGMSSASEMYQHEIATVLAGIDGADSISDGPDQPTHDRRLREVLQRLHDTDKRIFNIVSLAFMGMLLTEKGIGPTGERVSAILDDREPENVTERRSFLGLANFQQQIYPPLCDTTRATEETNQEKHAICLWSRAEGSIPSTEAENGRGRYTCLFRQEYTHHARCRRKPQV